LNILGPIGHEVDAAQQADPEYSVKEGAAVLIATQPAGSHKPTSNPPTVSTSFADYYLSLSGENFIAVVLDEIAPTAARATGVVAVAGGPLWGGHLGNEASVSSTAGSMFSPPGGPVALRSALLRRTAS
jgi:hypothetical protein